MTTEEVEKKAKKRKRVRKDKWGQPVLDGEAAAAAELVEPPKEEKDADGIDGSGGGEDASDSLYEGNKVVVSGMPYTASEEEIRDFFKDVGSVVHLQLSRFPDSGNFRGLAFVTFETEEMATSSLELDGMEMGNRFIKVERCRVDPHRKKRTQFLSEPEKVDGCCSAYIGNLSWGVTEDDIKKCFETSKIDSIRFAYDKKTGKFRGFCHVDFADDESLENAMQKDQVELHGRPMKVAYAVSARS